MQLYTVFDLPTMTCKAWIIVKVRTESQNLQYVQISQTHHQEYLPSLYCYHYKIYQQNMVGGELKELLLYLLVHPLTINQPCYLFFT